MYLDGKLNRNAFIGGVTSNVETLRENINIPGFEAMGGDSPGLVQFQNYIDSVKLRKPEDF